MRLSPLALGISLGIISGLCMLIFALSTWQWSYGTEMMALYTSIFPGFEASLKGSLIGLAWGFLEGFVIGIIWAWIYNLCICHRCCSGCCCKTGEKPTDTKNW